MGKDVGFAIGSHQMSSYMNAFIALKTNLFIGFLLVGNPLLWSQSLISRTGHVRVQSTTKHVDVVANNYQVAGRLDLTNQKLEFSALIRSFEFDLGMANQIFNSKKFNLTDYPKADFKGTFTPIGMVDLSKPGTYKAKISGTLVIGDFDRLTETIGDLIVDSSGNITGSADFVMALHPDNVQKISNLMKKYIPEVLNVNTTTLGVSGQIKVRAKIPYTRA